MEELENILNKCGFVKKNHIKNDFHVIENLIGFQLPADYKYYQDNYEKFEGFIGEQSIVLYGYDDLLGLNDEVQYLSNKIIIIGSNGASEVIGVRLVDQYSYQVVTAQYIQDVDGHIVVGSSFTDMLKRLNDGIPWFK